MKINENAWKSKDMQRNAMKSNRGHDAYHGGGPLASELAFQSILKLKENNKIPMENLEFRKNAFETSGKTI